MKYHDNKFHENVTTFFTEMYIKSLEQISEKDRRDS